MATHNNLHIPDELLGQAQRIAESQGRTADEVAADALKRYVARSMLDELSCYGQQRAREMGLDRLSEDEQMEYVDRVIHQSRKEYSR